MHKNSKLTEDMLRAMGACSDGMAWFAKHFPNGATFEECIAELNKQKSSYGYSDWLYDRFNLTGVARDFYENGRLFSEYGYNNGMLDGKSTIFTSSGEVLRIMYYKNGKHVRQYNG